MFQLFVHSEPGGDPEMRYVTFRIHKTRKLFQAARKRDTKRYEGVKFDPDNEDTFGETLTSPTSAQIRMSEEDLDESTLAHELFHAIYGIMPHNIKVWAALRRDVERQRFAEEQIAYLIQIVMSLFWEDWKNGQGG